MPVSVVVPICNELENIPLLYQQLAAVLPSLSSFREPHPWEVVFVDDGSTDGSSERLKELANGGDADVEMLQALSHDDSQWKLAMYFVLKNIYKKINTVENRAFDRIRRLERIGYMVAGCVLGGLAAWFLPILFGHLSKVAATGGP